MDNLRTAFMVLAAICVVLTLLSIYLGQSLYSLRGSFDDLSASFETEKTNAAVRLDNAKAYADQAEKAYRVALSRLLDQPAPDPLHLTQWLVRLRDDQSKPDEDRRAAARLYMYAPEQAVDENSIELAQWRMMKDPKVLVANLSKGLPAKLTALDLEDLSQGTLVGSEWRTAIEDAVAETDPEFQVADDESDPDQLLAMVISHERQAALDLAKKFEPAVPATNFEQFAQYLTENGLISEEQMQAELFRFLAGDRQAEVPVVIAQSIAQPTT